MTTKWLTVQGASEWSRMGESTLRTWIREGKLPVTRPSGRPNGRILIDRDVLNEAILANAKTAPAEARS